MGQVAYNKANMDAAIDLSFTVLRKPVPEFVYRNLAAYSAAANTYQPQPAELVQRLAAKHSIDPAMIWLTAGADEAIQMFALAFGHSTRIFTPTYAHYDCAANFYARVIHIPALHDKQYIIPTAHISGATLIYLANPNNPCGYTTKEAIRVLLANNPHAVVVVDEVYGDFAPDLSMVPDIAAYPNLAILRSFSKSYGMAGNRIGYIMASPAILAKVQPKTQRASISYLSVGAAMAALDHEAYFMAERQAIVERRIAFAGFLERCNLTTYPCSINAVLIRLPDVKAGTAFIRHLQKHGFIVSHGNGSVNVGLNDSFVRITIGLPIEMERLKACIDTFH